MGRRDIPDYRGVTIRVVDDPAPQEIGGGWWRIEWEVTGDRAKGPSRLRLPAPPAELGTMLFVVAVLPREDGHITVQMLSKNPKLEWNEYAYLSLVMQSIKEMYAVIRINGQENHPVLKISRM